MTSQAFHISPTSIRGACEDQSGQTVTPPDPYLDEAIDLFFHSSKFRRENDEFYEALDLVMNIIRDEAIRIYEHDNPPVEEDV